MYKMVCHDLSYSYILYYSLNITNNFSHVFNVFFLLLIDYVRYGSTLVVLYDQYKQLYFGHQRMTTKYMEKSQLHILDTKRV